MNYSDFLAAALVAAVWLGFFKLAEIQRFGVLCKSPLSSERDIPLSTIILLVFTTNFTDPIIPAESAIYMYRCSIVIFNSYLY